MCNSYKDVRTKEEYRKNVLYEFFANIGPSLARNIDDSGKHFTDFLGDTVHNSLFLEPTSCHEILTDIGTLKIKPQLQKMELVCHSSNK